MKKLSTLLALIVALTAITACAGENDSSYNADTTAAVTEAETSEIDARKAISDDLPAKDFDGKQFRIYSSPGRETTFYAEDQNGEVINDAIYNAIVTTEERFNVDVVNVPSGGDDVGHNDKIRTAITAGDDAFEIAENHDSL